MLREKIKYTDYDGVERTETFYFNLNEAELTELDLTTEGGMKNLIERIIDAQDQKTVIELFKRFIMLSYGEKSPDGKRFMKSPELSKAFAETEAYNVLFMRLFQEEGAAAAFFNAIIVTDKTNNPPPVRTN